MLRVTLVTAATAATASSSTASNSSHTAHARPSGSGSGSGGGLFRASAVLLQGMYTNNVTERFNHQRMEQSRLQERAVKTSTRFGVEPADESLPGTFIGIDLGTTNSCISYIDPETQKPKIIPSPSGSWVFPTAVTFDKNHQARLYAEEARSTVRSSASATLCSGKRLIGRRYGELSRVSAQMQKTNTLQMNERGEVSVEISGRVYTVTHIIGMFLRYLKKMAEEYLQMPVYSAVVSVPAYFTPQQKVATEDAALIAGFDVLEIIDEPSAACLAYSALHPKKEGEKDLQTSLVFDLGGGTLDCALMDHNATAGKFALVATHGDPVLGGNDWDNAIAKYISDNFKKKWRIDLDRHEVNPGTAAADFRVMLLEAERCKVHFSHSLEDYRGYQRNFHFSELRRDIIPLEVNMTFKQYLEMTRTLRARCIDVVDRLLREAGRKPSDVDNILLVGAMTRDPPIRVMLSDFFDREPTASHECPADYAVAIGASVRAGMLNGMFSDLHRDTSFVKGSLQAQRSVNPIVRLYNTVAAKIGEQNPNAIGHKWRGTVKGLDNEDIEKYAREIVEFEASCDRRDFLEQAESDANKCMQRVLKNNYKKQGMQEKTINQLSDQLKFWQYMVRNFHDHEEHLARTVKELSTYLDAMEGLAEDSSELTEEGTIDFSQNNERRKVLQRMKDEMSDDENVTSKLPSEVFGDDGPSPKSPLTFGGATPPSQDPRETKKSSPRGAFMDPYMQNDQDKTRKSTQTKILRREVPLPKTSTVDDIIDKGSPHFLTSRNDYDLSETTRQQIFTEYVNDRAWREPPSPPEEEGSWQEVKSALERGENIGEAIPTEEVVSPPTAAERLRWVEEELPVELDETAFHAAEMWTGRASLWQHSVKKAEPAAPTTPTSAEANVE